MTSTSPLPDNWRRQLTRAFEILLGGPLSDHPGDAVHVAYVGGNVFDEFGYNRVADWVRPAALRGAEPVVLDCSLFDAGEPPSRFDAANSVFEFEDVRETGHAAFAADLAGASFGGGLVRGGDLAVLAERHGVDLADDTWTGRWYVPYPRLVSDGTLWDAMRVALTLGDGPADVLPLEGEAAEEWAEALEAVEDPGLRAHLAHYCGDGDSGLLYLRSTGDVMAEEGCSVVANWEEGQSQVEFTVVRLSDLVAGPARA
ncbi:hypothetical protein [Saccharothrix obliqua]|uniref:hypothetical protein n=1 Tax=Saccharothrix obliqua TaxID=2861747 RepID=UPI001C5E8DCD|nr:hypothetical protein [Saccharothrix obliqua]MBW4717558.1 hypothetical protein [Saccharothrix obliqua]